MHPIWFQYFQTNGLDKSRQAFNVLDFGAIGDGVVDDSASIQGAINAVAAIGSGAVYLPSGHTFKAVGLTWAGSGRLRIYGDGPGTFFSLATTTGILFTGTNGYIDIDSMTVLYPVGSASTAGYFFKFSNAFSTSTFANVRNIDFFNGFNAVRWEDGCDQSGAFDIRVRGLKNDLFQVDVSPSLVGQQHGNITFGRVTAQSFSSNTGVALRLVSADGIIVSDCLLHGFFGGVLAQPSASRSYLANLFFTECVIDGAGGPATQSYGFRFDGTNNPMLRVSLVNCWAGFIQGGIGLSAVSTKTLSWVAGYSIDNGQYGIVVDAGCQDVLLEGLTVTGNSSAAAGTYDGILVFTGADKVRIKNCRSGATFNTADAVTQTNSQRYGIVVNNVGTVNYELIGNDVSGNLTGGISDSGGAGGRRIVRDNVGYNPIGVSAIVLGASPATYTAGATPETVYIAGGTVSNISVSGTQVASATSGVPVAIPLNPNQAMVVTYTVAPTITVTNKQ